MNVIELNKYEIESVLGRGVLLGAAALVGCSIVATSTTFCMKRSNKITFWVVTTGYLFVAALGISVGYFLDNVAYEYLAGLILGY